MSTDSPAPALARRLRALYPRARRRVYVSPKGQSVDPERPLESYRSDPVGFCAEVLGVELTPDQRDIIRGLPGRVKVNAGHSVGKAQPLDTPIDTPIGRRAFGDLKVSDEVFGVTGKPVTVVGVYPQGRLKAYRVTFDDRTSTVVGGEHLWTVRGRNERRTGTNNWLTLTTEELIARGVKRRNGANDARLWEIPQHGPVEYPHKAVAVPAYTTGAWLGDGTVGIGAITSADSEVLAAIKADGFDVRVFDEKSAAKRLSVYGLKIGLRAVGILDVPTDRKRVPIEYMENSADVRLAVLQGLMDTDGTCGTNGVATFCSTSSGLVDDVAWLVRSLGGKAYIHETPKQGWYRDADGNRIDGKLAHQVTVVLSGFALFRIERKQSRVRDGGRLGTRERMIESIEPCGAAEMQCIMVDAPDGLYLTNDFIVTHNTLLAACAALWWFYARPNSVVITTAPTQQDVVDLLWTEIRIRHARARRRLPDYFSGPKAPEMFHHEEHWAKGYTARDAVSFQGRHRESMLFLFDECEGVAPHFWTVTNTSYKPDEDHGWLAIGNPVTTASQSYLEDRALAPDGAPKWKLHTLSAMNHPNVLAQLRGEKPPVPNAVSLEQVDQWVQDWSDEIAPGDRREGDFEWRPGSGRWFRPGPQMKARAMGVRPVEGVDTVWGMGAWTAAVTPRYTDEYLWLNRCGVTIGQDSAAFGDDYSVIHVRSGPVSLHHEARNGWSPRQLAERLKELCVEWTAWYNSRALAGMDRPPLLPSQARVRIELDVSGADVLDHCNGFGDWEGVKVSEASDKLDSLGTPKYFNVRSELWFEGAKLALAGGMDLSRLPVAVLARLQTQLMTPSYKSLPAGTRQVESKDDIKKRLKRSPDDADGLLVCYSDARGWAPTLIWKGDDGRDL